MRQRRPLVASEAEVHPLFDRPAFKTFSRLDIYPKVSNDVQRRTTCGGLVSLLCAGFILLLIAHETYHYFVGSDAYHDYLTVDEGVTALVPVNLNITFPSLNCLEVNLDVMDASGAQQHMVRMEIFKSPVSAWGSVVYLGPFRYHSKAFDSEGNEIAVQPSDNPANPSFCGSCYLAERGPSTPMCCNRCEQVQQAHIQQGLSPPPMESIEQCLPGLYQMYPGCNVHGTVFLQKVKGNIHFAPGLAMEGANFMGNRGLGHVHINLSPSSTFNTSHVIHHLSFGRRGVRRLGKRGVAFPLDGTRFITPPDSVATVKYFVSIVPSVYQQGRRMAEAAYEYAVTVHHSVSPVGTGAIPALYLAYDFYPIKIIHRFSRESTLHFLVKVSSLVGGLFVVSGIIDKVIYWLTLCKGRLRETQQQQL